MHPPFRKSAVWELRKNAFQPDMVEPLFCITNDSVYKFCINGSEHGGLAVGQAVVSTGGDNLGGGRRRGVDGGMVAVSVDFPLWVSIRAGGRRSPLRWEGCRVDRRDVEARRHGADGRFAVDHERGWCAGGRECRQSCGPGTTASAAVGVEASAVRWSPCLPVDRLRSLSLWVSIRADGDRR